MKNIEYFSNFDASIAFLRYKAKGLFVVFIFLSSFLYSLPKSQQDSGRKINTYYDKNKDLLKRIEILESELAKRDEIHTVAEKIVKIDYVEKNVNDRVDDLKGALAISISGMLFLVGVVGAITFNKLKYVARQTAEEEFKNKFEENLQKIQNAQTDAEICLNKIKENMEFSTDARTVNATKDILEGLGKFIKESDANTNSSKKKKLQSNGSDKG